MEMQTWYVMEDETFADPAEVAPDKKGILRHADGRAVAYAPHGPRTRQVNPAEARKAKPKASAERDMKADDRKPGYTTRESKAD